MYATLLLPTYIGFEAALSFLGVGVIPPDTTFGTMLANSVAYFNVVPTYLFIPGTLLVVLVVTFNLLGDRIARRPRSKDRLVAPCYPARGAPSRAAA